MNKRKILFIIGTRPECIKLGPVIQMMGQYKDLAVPVVVSTGQHKEMLKQALDIFGIQPDYELDVMTHNQSLATLTGKLFTELDHVIRKEAPSWIVVQGDTTSVMVGSIVGFYNRVRVAHIEAGLRTHNKYSPFPEEINRAITGVVADAHFAPTERSKKNLIREGINEESIIVSGNTVVDAVKYIADQSIPQTLPVVLDRPYILVTAHRRENFGNAMQDMFEALREIANKFPEVDVIYPVHLNPNVQEKAQAILSQTSNIRLIEPLQYTQFVHLLKNARLILTDSGGVQEEAPSFGVPVLVMRDTTERPEGIEAGVSKLVGTNKETIVKEATNILKQEHKRNLNAINPFGDGHASERILDVLCGVGVPA